MLNTIKPCAREPHITVISESFPYATRLTTLIKLACIVAFSPHSYINNCLSYQIKPSDIKMFSYLVWACQLLATPRAMEGNSHVRKGYIWMDLPQTSCNLIDTCQLCLYVSGVQGWLYINSGKIDQDMPTSGPILVILLTFSAERLNLPLTISLHLPAILSSLHSTKLSWFQILRRSLSGYSHSL